MITDAEIKKQIGNTLKETNLPFKKYAGKVRDNYDLNGKRLIVTTDRISAFDVVLDTIPFKGQVLNQTSAFWFGNLGVKNHLLEVPDPNAMIVKKCNPIPIEVVIRAYLTGSAWRDYEKGNPVSGINLPSGMRRNDKLKEPILTPSTKAETGHDVGISGEEIVEKGIVDRKDFEKIKKTALEIFKKGSHFAEKKGLLLVDTKYEFGFLDNEFILIDEVHTPDSSRFWTKESYLLNQQRPHMLDKEYLRSWLISKGYMGDGNAPAIPEEIKLGLAGRYILLYEMLTEQKFKTETEMPIYERLKMNLRKKGYLK